jgi:hypothetical protein
MLIPTIIRLDGEEDGCTDDDDEKDVVVHKRAGQKRKL